MDCRRLNKVYYMIVVSQTVPGCGSKAPTRHRRQPVTNPDRPFRGADSTRGGHEGEDVPALAQAPAESFQHFEATRVCRNIRILFNFDPPVTEDEIHAASLQFVRKISGFNKPSKANEPAFLAAVAEIAAVSARLLGSLETNAPPRDRAVEADKARARASIRYSKVGDTG
jgi:hypothetical protein